MVAEASVGLAKPSRPWVTWGLLLACVISLAYTQRLEWEVGAGADAALDRAIAYHVEHAYLELPALLEARLEQTAHSTASGSDGRRILESVRDSHQQTLDELVIAAVAPYAELPKYRRGLSATERTPSSWISYPLLHDGWLHLVGNGLLLLLLGAHLERVWRSALFGGFLIATTLVSGWTFGSANPGFADPLIGSLGIVAGLLGAYSVRFARTWRNPSYALLLLAGIGWLIVPDYAGWEPSIARLATSAADTAGRFGPSLGAVAGGLGFGIILAIAVALAGIERELPEVLADLDATQTNEVLASALDAHAAGRSEEAEAILADLVRIQPNNIEPLLATWQIDLALGRHDDAVTAMTRVVKLEIRAGDQQAAIEHWSELVERGLEGRVQPNLAIRLALLLATAGRDQDAAHAFQSALNGAQGKDAASVAARIARAARDFHPVIAEDAAWRALSESGLGIEERQGLEALLAQLGTRAGEAAARIEQGCSEEASEVSLGREGETPNATPGGSVPVEQPVRAPQSSDPLVQWDNPELSDDVTAMDEPLELVASGDESVVVEGSTDLQNPTPIALEFTSRRIEVLECLPIALLDSGFDVEVGVDVKKRIPYERMEAICVAAIAAQGGKPVLILDLILNWNAGTQDELKLIRLRSDHFDPRRLISTDGGALDAMRAVIDHLLSRSGATPLPDRAAARGYPFVSFSDIESYEHSILSVEPKA